MLNAFFFYLRSFLFQKKCTDHVFHIFIVCILLTDIKLCALLQTFVSMHVGHPSLADVCMCMVACYMSGECFLFQFMTLCVFKRNLCQIMCLKHCVHVPGMFSNESMYRICATRVNFNILPYITVD